MNNTQTMSHMIAALTEYYGGDTRLLQSEIAELWQSNATRHCLKSDAIYALYKEKVLKEKASD